MRIVLSWFFQCKSNNQKFSIQSKFDDFSDWKVHVLWSEKIEFHVSMTFWLALRSSFQIPHLETRWDYRLRRESCLVNLYPHPSTLSKAYVDLVRSWGWKQFTIIYETNEGLVRLQELLKAHGPSEYPITVRQLSDNGDYRSNIKFVLSIEHETNRIFIHLLW